MEREHVKYGYLWLLLFLCAGIIALGSYGLYLRVDIMRLGDTVNVLQETTKSSNTQLQDSIKKLAVTIQETRTSTKEALQKVDARFLVLESIQHGNNNPMPQLKQIWRAIRNLQIEVQSIKDAVDVSKVETVIHDQNAYQEAVKPLKEIEGLPKLKDTVPYDKMTPEQKKKMDDEMKPPKGF